MGEWKLGRSCTSVGLGQELIVLRHAIANRIFAPNYAYLIELQILYTSSSKRKSASLSRSEPKTPSLCPDLYGVFWLIICKFTQIRHLCQVCNRQQNWSQLFSDEEDDKLICQSMWYLKKFWFRGEVLAGVRPFIFIGSLESGQYPSLYLRTSSISLPLRS